MRRLATALSLCIVLAFASEAGAASVLLGPPTLQESFAPSATCYSLPSQTPCDQTAVITLMASPHVYEAPGDGVITSWRVLAGVAGDGHVHLRVFRRADGGQLTGVSTSAAASAFNGTTSNITALAVQRGDLIGVDAIATGSNANVSTQADMFTGYTQARFSPHVPDGATETPDASGNGMPAINATVELTPPSVASISPVSGSTAGGEAVTITGEHLAGATSVTFGGAVAAITSNSNTEVVVTTPPGAAGTADVVVTTAGGSASGAYRYDAPPGDPGGGTPPPGGGSTPADTTKPVISAYVVSPSAFVAANTGPALIAAVGGRVVYRLSEAATVRFTVERKLAGRRKGRRCVAPQRARRGKRCIRWSRVSGSFTHAGAGGLNTFRFMGRLGGKPLRRGNYRLVAVATDGAGNASKAARHPFRITR